MLIKIFDADRPNEIYKRGLTLEQAKEFCAGPKGQRAGYKMAFTKEN